jgi:hypothetical protein
VCVCVCVYISVSAMEFVGAHVTNGLPCITMDSTGTHGIQGWPWVPAKVQIILYVGTNPQSLSHCQKGCLDSRIIRIGDVKTD